MKAKQILVPAVLLILLGMGNIGVGLYKVRQYDVVVRELEDVPSVPEELRASPLMRVQIAKYATDKGYLRQQRAQTRRDYYRLVVIGGRVFLAIGLVLFAAAAALKAAEPTSADSSPEPDQLEAP